MPVTLNLGTIPEPFPLRQPVAPTMLNGPVVHILYRSPGTKEALLAGKALHHIPLPRILPAYRKAMGNGGGWKMWTFDGKNTYFPVVKENVIGYYHRHEPLDMCWLNWAWHTFLKEFQAEPIPKSAQAPDGFWRGDLIYSNLLNWWPEWVEKWLHNPHEGL